MKEVQCPTCGHVEYVDDRTPEQQKAELIENNKKLIMYNMHELDKLCFGAGVKLTKEQATIIIGGWDDSVVFHSLKDEE